MVAINRKNIIGVTGMLLGLLIVLAQPLLPGETETRSVIVQGFGYARPQPAADFLPLLQMPEVVEASVQYQSREVPCPWR